MRGLREKTEGPGIMVSGFQDEIRGFGFAMTEAELLCVNTFRATQKRKPIEASPGLRYLDYGKNKEGYWNFDMFDVQCVDIMDCFEVLYPQRQLVMEVDHSAGHAKYREDGLYVGNINVKWGGAKGGGMRNTKVTESCLGPHDALMIRNGKAYDCRLKPGDVQRFTFQPGDPPPFYELDAHPKDRPRGHRVTTLAVGGVSTTTYQKIAQGASSDIMGTGAVDRGHEWERATQYRFKPTRRLGQLLGFQGGEICATAFGGESRTHPCHVSKMPPRISGGRHRVRLGQE